MTTMQTDTTLDEDAARWAVLADNQPLDAAVQAELDAWLKESPRHHGAFVRACAVLAAVSDVGGAGADARPQGNPPRRKVLLWGSSGLVAAAAAASLAFGFFAKDGPVRYQAPRGEVRLLTMADGSIATLNTDTEISVRFTKSSREIQLIAGEALFEVAKDAARPFTVNMGDTVVRAVGTAFVVRNLTGEPAQVLVSEGAVDMFRASSKRGGQVRVPANARAVALDVPYPTVRITDTNLDPEAVARKLAWRRGMLVFESATLKQAAAEFGRYSDVRIIIDDPQIADLRITGLFSAANPVEFARGAAASHDLKVEITPTGIMLWR